MEALIGAIVGILGLVVSVMLFRIEKQRDAKAEVQTHEERAEGFKIWIAAAEVTGEKSRYGVHVQNVTSGSISDVVAVTTTAKGTLFPRDLRIGSVPPGDFFFTSSFEGGGKWDFGTPAGEVLGLHPIMRKREWRVVCAGFRDSTGQWWIRDDKGLHACVSEQVVRQQVQISRQSAMASRVASKATRSSEKKTV